MHARRRDPGPPRIGLELAGRARLQKAVGEAREVRLDSGQRADRGDLLRVEALKAKQRVKDGAIGDIVAVETTYNSGGVWDPRRTRDQVSSEMEYQMRNWYYYDWLSGDQQWAIDVCFDAGLSLRPGAPIALRGQQRMAPYIPCGAFG